MSATEPSLIAERAGPLARLTMNRPRALNALDQGMIDAFAEAIAEWRDDAGVTAIVLEGAGGRAFCAGGDVRAIRTAAIAGDAATVERFFSSEYAVNQAIADCEKPWISLIDGVCMGGGIGVSIHGSHRVVTEQAMLAMPETAIALFPDVGTSFALPRLPGHLGLWLALTGARLHGADAVHAGLATHFVPRERLDALRAALATGDAGAVARHAEPPPPASFAAHAEAIDACFGAGSIPSILAALEAEPSEWAAAQVKALRHASPTSLFATHELLARGGRQSLPACLATELALTRVVVNHHPDFREGVRAVLVDKDNAPRWTPPRIEDVDPGAIAAMFEGAAA
ncbi:enoyl-CoA hydratase/isomerase family protein [Plastoroseomonas arctica]|uniref:3-hydroxyisobutyryl-CoA hydrolase n=1 Tax=Plastoroseomonas arctica TaxID=1509237 RepID=A0AAF1K2T0_9PROT|nr:enoyl-CoA hydratase/isomerase family protein [Plastoroseomonas arctica]MBR0655743.1 enoyl-CoA hydratase/isomerase family protein [Plastoroseomonas arctica]